MDLSTLENWLWRAACSIRGEVDAARYKDYILPLVFYKRLDDVYSDELTRLATDLSLSLENAEALVAQDRDVIRFYIPADARWTRVRKATTGLGELLTDSLRAIARENAVNSGQARWRQAQRRCLAFQRQDRSNDIDPGDRFRRDQRTHLARQRAKQQIADVLLLPAIHR